MNKTLRLMAAAIGSMAFVFFLVLEAGYFPFDESTALATAWLGLSGESAPTAPLWGAFLKFIGESSARSLGIVSVMAGAVASALFTYLAGRLLVHASEQAEDRAQAKELRYEPVMIIGAMLAGLAFIFTPGFLTAATRLSPLMVQLALPFGALALAVMSRTNNSARTVCSFFAGALTALGVLEGMPGMIALPLIVIMLVWHSETRSEGVVPHLGLFVLGAVLGLFFMLGDGGWTERCYRIVRYYRGRFPSGLAFPGLGPFLAVGVAPLLVLWQLCRTGRMATKEMRRVYFGGWAMAVLSMGAVTFHNLGDSDDRAADSYVTRCLKSAEGKRWLISDGAFDDLILLKAPKETHLVTFRREHEPEYGRLLAQWAREEVEVKGGGEGEGEGKVRGLEGWKVGDGWKELEFAAELGPAKFVQTMFETGSAAASDAYVISVRDLNVRSAGKTYLPRRFGWELADKGAYDAAALAREWQMGWATAKTLDKDGEAAKLIRHIYAVQGNAVGALASEAGNPELAWQVHYKVFDEISPESLSNLVNMLGLMERGYEPSKMQRQRVEEAIKKEFADITSQYMLQRLFDHYGRIFVDEVTRERVANLREEMKRRAWESEEGREIKSAFDDLDKVYHQRGEAFRAAVAELEAKHLKKMSNNRDDNVIKWFFVAEVHALKDGEENLRIARENYRKVLESGNAGQVDLVADRILSMDVSLNDLKEMEYDALLILKNSLRHRYANALLGTLRAQAGEYESAERYLRRAMEVGRPEPGMKNDLAMVLSSQKKHEEAELYAREAVKEGSESWNYRETLARVLKAAGKVEEAKVELATARELATKAGQLEAFKKAVGK